jgi:ATP-dependent DNA helicase RecG
MRRYLPMPDYDLSEPHAVTLTIYGAVIDEAYTNLLMQRTDLPLTDILALDRVQKDLPITEEITKHLRQQGLISGRKPHLHVSPTIANATATRSGSIQVRNQDDLYYLRLVVDYLTQFGTATRADVNNLLFPILPDSLNSDEKSRKVANLLTKLRRDGHIQNDGSRTNPLWVLSD